MILSTEHINNLCNNEQPLISPYDAQANQGNPAKIELHLGSKCYCSNTPNKIYKLDEEGTVVIEPNTIFLFETQEKFNFPANLSGKMSLKMKYISKGLLMPSQTQVDPGYNNVLFGMIYNLSSEQVVLEYGTALTTLEVFETEESVENRYNGSMQQYDFEKFVSTRVHSSLGTLERDIRKSQKVLNASVKWWNAFAVAISIILAVMSIYIGTTNYRAAAKDDADIAELRYCIADLQTQLVESEQVISEQNKKLNELEQLIEEIQSNSTVDTFVAAE